MKKCVVSAVVWLLVLWSATQAQAPANRETSSTAPGRSTPVIDRALVDKYCVSCHNARLKTGDLALDAVDMADIPARAEVWEKVVRKLRSHMMPPAGAMQPDAPAVATFVSSLEGALDRGAAARPTPGRTLLHRFNRAEYANAVRDLLALEVDPVPLLPPDDSTFGFDNISDILGISPLLMERYVSAAERISALAVGDPSLPKTSALYRLRNDLPQGEHIDGLPIGTRGGALIRHTFPLDGEYVIKLKLWRTSVGFTRGLQQQHELEVSLDGARAMLAPVGGEADYRLSVLNAGALDIELDGRLRTRVKATAGPHDVLATFIAIAGGVATGPESLRPSMFAVDPLYIHGVPGIESLIIEGPFNATVPRETPSRRAIFTCKPTSATDEATCARTILTRLARRAYRRPVTDADVQPLLAMYRTGRTNAGFEQGIEVALQGILTSPYFLFRAEQDPPALAAGAAHRITNIELASRLSFFLWSSIPDEPLLALAAQGTLGQPAVLEREVRRMLKDPRAGALVANFGGQWLHLRNLAAFVPDRTDFPEFDDLLRQAMRRETELFLASVIDEDRSALDLLRADYTFVNERLARHYGMRGVYGANFRRVSLTDPSRYGLLGQASVLAVTSYPNRTSPVVRGRWILENILGATPAPPPPNVPPLADTAKPKTMRERMSSHRANPVCASCHRVMDPIGLALENFDATGAWRSKDGEAPIDASDTLADGTKVDGPVALRQALLREPDRFVATLTEKLMTYGLGRGLDYNDMPAVRAIVRDAAASDYRMSSIIMGIVKSVPFQMRTKPPAGEAPRVASR
jgi:mono/diheme cytochrome c family protein